MEIDLENVQSQIGTAIVEMSNGALVKVYYVLLPYLLASSFQSRQLVSLLTTMERHNVKILCIFFWYFSYFIYTFFNCKSAELYQMY